MNKTVQKWAFMGVLLVTALIINWLVWSPRNASREVLQTNSAQNAVSTEASNSQQVKTVTFTINPRLSSSNTPAQ